MTKTNIIRKLRESNYVTSERGDGQVQVSIDADIFHQKEYENNCTEAVVQPLINFCAINNLQMRRVGRFCVVENK